MGMNEQPPHGRGYEERDASFKAIVKWAVGLAVAVAIVPVLMWAVFHYFAARPEKFPPPSPMAGARPPYAGPKLQVRAPQELKEWHAAEDAVLNSSAWVDPDKGVVRIPVSRAIELLAERGLPTKIEEGGPKP
jgi:hypothetical protein